MTETDLSLAYSLDSHAHILEYGASRLIPLEAAKNVNGTYSPSVCSIYCLDLTNLAEAVASVREYIVSDPEVYGKSDFVEGWGWDHTSWPMQHWPTAVCISSFRNVIPSHHLTISRPISTLIL